METKGGSGSRIIEIDWGSGVSKNGLLRVSEANEVPISSHI